MSGEPEMTQDASGTFEVTVTPLEPSPGSDGALAVFRFKLKKTFAGQLEGKAVGTMMSIGTPKLGNAAVYVALDQFSGTLAGRRGTFVLVHRATMSKTGVADLDVRIATDSGTGELEGITGSLGIDAQDGKHLYHLSYTLPAAD
jgi:hypothetical protein